MSINICHLSSCSQPFTFSITLRRDLHELQTRNRTTRLADTLPSLYPPQWPRLVVGHLVSQFNALATVAKIKSAQRRRQRRQYKITHTPRWPGGLTASPPLCLSLSLLLSLSLFVVVILVRLSVSLSPSVLLCFLSGGAFYIFNYRLRRCPCHHRVVRCVCGAGFVRTRPAESLLWVPPSFHIYISHSFTSSPAFSIFIAMETLWAKHFAIWLNYFIISANRGRGERNGKGVPISRLVIIDFTLWHFCTSLKLF